MFQPPSSGFVACHHDNNNHSHANSNGGVSCSSATSSLTPWPGEELVNNRASVDFGTIDFPLLAPTSSPAEACDGAGVTGISGRFARFSTGATAPLAAVTRCGSAGASVVQLGLTAVDLGSTADPVANSSCLPPGLIAQQPQPQLPPGLHHLHHHAVPAPLPNSVTDVHLANCGVPGGSFRSFITPPPSSSNTAASSSSSLSSSSAPATFPSRCPSLQAAASTLLPTSTIAHRIRRRQIPQGRQHHRHRQLQSDDVWKEGEIRQRTCLQHFALDQPVDTAGKMESMDQHGMEAQQAAAKEYQPVREGPLVGDKAPSSVVTQEYAKADPVYVEKTLALPQTYSHYRPIQGDGNCGWRAIGFSYYEKLIDMGDQTQMEGEVARLTSLNQLLESVGGYTYYEDFADEAIGLLRELAATISNPDVAHMLLLQRWNDPAVTNAIIYYLRLLSATSLKSNPAMYEPFIPDGLGVHGYCSQSIELVDREIEHLGIDGLADILLKPVNMVLEIAYLDRSPGSHLNRYRFPKEANDQDVSSLGPIIYLLYRPDHYDIMYCDMQPSQPNVASVDMQVNRVTGFSHNTDITSPHADLATFATADFGALGMIPGFNPTMAMMPPLPSPATTVAHSSASPSSTMSEPFCGMPQGAWMAGFPLDMHSSGPHQSHQGPGLPNQSLSPAHLPTSTAMAHASNSIMANSPMAGTPDAVPRGPGVSPETGYHIRFSPVQLDYDESQSAFPDSAQVTTMAFKNSVYNKAHFGNPDFHPEEWCPEDESFTGKPGGKRRARKDS